MLTVRSMSNKYSFLILIGVACATLVSCSEHSRVKRIMSDFVKSEIRIPNDLECIYNGEVIEWEIDTLKHYKFIVYYDSLDCSSCRINNLSDLLPIYGMADTSNFTPMTIFSPRRDNIEDVRMQLFMANYDFPIYLDVSGNFSTMNKCIPDDSRFHYFLISDEGIPLVVGNPITHEIIFTLMTKIIYENSTP